MAATLRAPARAAVASSSSRRARYRSSRRTLAASASASPRGSEVEVITFDLDDTLWPTTPVVMAANQAFVDFCQERIPGFPDCAGVNEYMKVSARAARAPNLTFRARHPDHPFSAPPAVTNSSSSPPPPRPLRSPMFA